MPEYKKKLTLKDRARIFLTPVSTYNLFPELNGDLDLGNKPLQISYNVTKLILTHSFNGIVERRGIARDEPGHTVLLSTARQGAELISLALQLQGFDEKGIEKQVIEDKEIEFIRLERQVDLVVENGVLMQKNYGGPTWENLNY